MENKIQQITKKTRIMFIIAALLVVISALIKVNHWPGSTFADLATTIGYTLAFIGLIIENKKLKKALLNISNN
jgi:hypothetical protein